ncbi:MAG: hypothetical protein J6A61_02250 [Clostridia bacterium]|nr:hypothetical protein [Clostridia bacterium]
MELIAKIMGIAVIGAMLAVFLKEKTPQFSMAVSLVTGILIFTLIAARLESVISQVKTMIADVGMEAETVNLVLKICGLGMIAEFFCNLIADAGEVAIAKKAELSAKVVMFLMILPLMGKVVNTVWSLF